MNIIIIKKTPANKIGNNLAIESDTIIKETKKEKLTRYANNYITKLNLDPDRKEKIRQNKITYDRNYRVLFKTSVNEKQRIRKKENPKRCECCERYYRIDVFVKHCKSNKHIKNNEKFRNFSI